MALTSQNKDEFPRDIKIAILEKILAHIPISMSAFSREEEKKRWIQLLEKVKNTDDLLAIRVALFSLLNRTQHAQIKQIRMLLESSPRQEGAFFKDCLRSINKDIIQGKDFNLIIRQKEATLRSLAAREEKISAPLSITTVSTFTEIEDSDIPKAPRGSYLIKKRGFAAFESQKSMSWNLVLQLIQKGLEKVPTVNAAKEYAAWNNLFRYVKITYFQSISDSIRELDEAKVLDNYENIIKLRQLFESYEDIVSKQNINFIEIINNHLKEIAKKIATESFDSIILDLHKKIKTTKEIIATIPPLAEELPTPEELNEIQNSAVRWELVMMLLTGSKETPVEIPPEEYAAWVDLFSYVTVTDFKSLSESIKNLDKANVLADYQKIIQLRQLFESYEDIVSKQNVYFIVMIKSYLKEIAERITTESFDVIILDLQNKIKMSKEIIATIRPFSEEFLTEELPEKLSDYFPPVETKDEKNPSLQPNERDVIKMDIIIRILQKSVAKKSIAKKAEKFAAWDHLLSSISVTDLQDISDQLKQLEEKTDKLNTAENVNKIRKLFEFYQTKISNPHIFAAFILDALQKIEKSVEEEDLIDLKVPLSPIVDMKGFDEKSTYDIVKENAAWIALFNHIERLDYQTITRMIKNLNTTGFFNHYENIINLRLLIESLKKIFPAGSSSFTHTIKEYLGEIWERITRGEKADDIMNDVIKKIEETQRLVATIRPLSKETIVEEDLFEEIKVINQSTSIDDLQISRSSWNLPLFSGQGEEHSRSNQETPAPLSSKKTTKR